MIKCTETVDGDVITYDKWVKEATKSWGQFGKNSNNN